MDCLIVDDDENNLHICEKILSDMGFSTAVAGSAPEAADYCKSNMPSVIILDWKMPYVSGIDFLKSLRLMVDGHKPAVVMCTSNHDSEHIQEALSSGANEYIMKPFDKNIMEVKLQRLGLLEF